MSETQQETLERAIPVGLTPADAVDLPVGTWLEYQPSERSSSEASNLVSKYQHPRPVDWQPVYLDGLSKRANITEAAESAGVRPSLPYHYRKVDPLFARAWAAAYEEGMDRIEGNLQEAARDTRSKGGVVASIFLLKGRRREVFGDRTEISGPGGGAVPIAHMVTTMHDQLFKMKQAQREASEGVEIPGEFAGNDTPPLALPPPSDDTLEGEVVESSGDATLEPELEPSTGGRPSHPEQSKGQPGS